MFKVPDHYRVRRGLFGTSDSAGNNGAFVLASSKFDRVLQVIASDGEGWEHVSVSCHDRCPTWEEMNFVKGLFWDDDDAVIQVHPPKSDYVNNHPFCLHLWRKANSNDFFQRPPAYMVGIKDWNIGR